SAQIVPQSSLTIQGPGANQLAISGNNSSRIFDLQGVSLSISGLTLENGNSTSGSAIRVDNAGQSLNVSNCDFQNNVAASEKGGFYFPATGGAIASFSPITVDQCDFTGNSAVAADGATAPDYDVADGGAIWVDGVNLQVTNSHFTSNYVIGGNGDVGGHAY